MDLRSVHLRNDGPDNRVLVLAATGQDRTGIVRVLSSAGFATEVSKDAEDLCQLIDEGAGAAVISEIALSNYANERLINTLQDQPTWSDFPLVLLTRRHKEGTDFGRLLERFQSVGHLVMLERPLHAAILINAVRTALRSRRRSSRSDIG